MKLRNAIVILIIWGCLPGAALGQSLASSFERLDRNQDDQVTVEEARNAAWFPRLLERYDVNADGRLQRSEVISPRRGGGTEAD